MLQENEMGRSSKFNLILRVNRNTAIRVLRHMAKKHDFGHRGRTNEKPRTIRPSREKLLALCQDRTGRNSHKRTLITTQLNIAEWRPVYTYIYNINIVETNSPFLACLKFLSNQNRYFYVTRSIARGYLP